MFHTNITKSQTITYTIIAPDKRVVKSSTVEFSAEEVAKNSWVDIDYVDCNNTEGLWQIKTSLGDKNDRKTLYVEGQEYPNYRDLFEIKLFGMSGMDLYMDDFRHYGSLAIIDINRMDLVQAYMFVEIVKEEYKEIAEDFNEDIKFRLLFNVVNSNEEIVSQRSSVQSLVQLSRFSIIVEGFADDVVGRFPQGDYRLDLFYKDELILQTPFRLANYNQLGEYALDKILK